MPRLLDNDMEIHRIGGGAFTFSGTRVERLGATEYTLVTIAVDETGSIAGFENDLRAALVTAVEACKKSPRKDFVLIRVVTFGSQYQNGVNEVHGFKPLSEIDPNDYPDIHPGGMTPLLDASYSSIGAMNAYGKQLADDDFSVNAIAFIVTDGGENDSTATMAMVKEETERAVRSEEIESLISVLIGVNAAMLKDELDRFKDEAGLTHFVDIGDATKGKLAKLAAFVSKSVSSQSQSLGSGSSGVVIPATI